MIRFFKNIRQKFAAENKGMAYLRYAVGEILLVVIGILIALQVNNWNEARKERLIEIKYLKNLKLDLITDLANLDSMIIDRNTKVSSATTLLTLTPPKSSGQLKAFETLLSNVYGWTSFTPRTNTMDELISSGNLNIIKNDSVKFYLLSIRDINESIAIYREHMRREYDNYLYDRSWLILDLRPFLDFDKTLEEGKVIDLNLSEEKILEIASQVAVFLKDRGIRNGLKLAIFNNHGITEKYNMLYAEIQKLIKFIDEDINQ